MRPLTLLVVSLASLAACSEEEPCTLIGCASALRVNFGAAPVAPPYSVTILADMEPLMFECAMGGLLSPDPGGAAACDATGFSFPRAPRSVTVTVRPFRDGGLATPRTLTATPAYTESRPNGPSCEPVCRMGAVTLP
jgi:hypothetical protein